MSWIELLENQVLYDAGEAVFIIWAVYICIKLVIKTIYLSDEDNES